MVRIMLQAKQTLHTRGIHKFKKLASDASIFFFSAHFFYFLSSRYLTRLRRIGRFFFLLLLLPKCGLMRCVVVPDVHDLRRHEQMKSDRV